MRLRRIKRVVGLGALGLAACTEAPADRAPIELRFSASVEPSSYVAEYEQDIQWGTADLERRYGAHYTLGAEGALLSSARLDSLRASLSTPHGDQTLDARHLSGIDFELTISPSGGRPDYPDNAPVLEMPGMLEGAVALSRLMDFGFPHLPDRPVEVGDRWTGDSTAPQIEAHVQATASATTEYTFTGWETIDGVDCARIDGRVSADVVAQPYDVHGAMVEFRGALEGDLTWFFDPASGVLVSMTGDTSSDGVLTAGGNDTVIKQITRVRIETVEGERP